MKNNEKPRKQLKVRSCYEHLGGKLGERLFERLIELEWFEKGEEDTRAYRITSLGEEMFAELGVDIYEKK